MLETGGMDDLAVCLYSLDTSGVREERPLFFYHLAKAGGIGVHTALLASNTLAERVTGANRTYIRFHADDDNGGTLKQLYERLPD